MIVSCGEALIDLLPGEDAGGEMVFRPRAGGSPFNVAVALARLGVPAGFCGGLSTDFFGRMLKAELAKSGVDTSFVEFSTRPTTLAFAHIADGEADYAFFDEGSAGRMLTDGDLPAFPKSVTALHFGSCSLAEEPCGSAFESLMQREQRDRVISLDPNIRPTLIKNRGGYLWRIDRMAAMSDIVKLSADDLAWLAPGADFAAVADRWLDHGAKLVVLTKGEAGSEARSKTAAAEVAATPTVLVDTIGAGDAFTAGMLAQLETAELLSKSAMGRLTSDEIAAALEFAGRAAAVTVARAGADPPWREELA